MKRCLTFATWWGTLATVTLLLAQTTPRMALPTGGNSPPVMTKLPASASTKAPVAATSTTLKPIFVAAQPLIEAAKTHELAPATPTFAPATTQETQAPARPAQNSGEKAADVDSLNSVSTGASPLAIPSPTSATQPEWRYAEKPVLSPTLRYDRTALLQTESPSGNRIRDCLLKASAEVQLPAQEAGVLVELQAFEGQEVKLNQPLGRIDDSQPRLQKKAAEAERAVTAEKGKSTVSERYAQKASDVALKEWQKAEESNRIAPNSVSQVEVMRLQLTWEKGKLEFERAQEERKIAGLTVSAKDVDVEAAEEAIRRRQLISPIAGTIVELTPHVGEWLKPGDPVLKIVNMEVLKIEGYVNIKHFRQDELQSRTVIAEVDMGSKVPLNVPAKIAFVSPVVEPGGEYRIKAEIQNRKNPQTGEWILKPGLSAELVLSAAPGNP